MLVRAARIGDLVRGHAGVAHKYAFVIRTIGAQHLMGRGLGVPAPRVVAPHTFIKAVVEIVIFQMLKFCARGAKQFLHHLDMRIHRAAHVEKQQHLDRIAPLGAGFDVKIAVFGGGADGAIHVKLVCRAVARPSAQALKGDLDVARAQLDIVVKIAKLALVPDLDRALMARFVLTDAHALGVVAMGAKGACAGGADPFAAALMAALLFLEALFEGLHQLIKAAKRLDLRAFFGAQMLFGQLFKPFLWQINGVKNILRSDRLEPVKACGEGAVKAVDQALVFDHGAAREVIEPLDVIGDKPGIHRLEKGQVFAQGNRQVGLSEVLEKRQKHRALQSVAMNDQGHEQAHKRKHERIDKGILQDIGQFALTTSRQERAGECAKKYPENNDHFLPVRSFQRAERGHFS